MHGAAHPDATRRSPTDRGFRPARRVSLPCRASSRTAGAVRHLSASKATAHERFTTDSPGLLPQRPSATSRIATRNDPALDTSPDLPGPPRHRPGFYCPCQRGHLLPSSRIIWCARLSHWRVHRAAGTLTFPLVPGTRGGLRQAGPRLTVRTKQAGGLEHAWMCWVPHHHRGWCCKSEPCVQEEA
jgi:hypothetical protein